MNSYLPGSNQRARYMRMDTAAILKRFHFCERALIVAQAGWLAGVSVLDAKIDLAKHLWQDALIGNDLRNRVFELRYPNRLLEVGDDAPIVEVFEEAINAPNGLAFVEALAAVYKPQLLAAYRAYLDVADAIADGPSIRFLKIAIQDKESQIEELDSLVDLLKAAADAPEQQVSSRWVASLQDRLGQVGALSLEAPAQPDQPAALAGRRPFQFAEVPARDSRFQQCRFYWPNVIDPEFPYGEGVMLQLRSAVSHLNEVWAIESGGAVLHAFADKLGWDYILDVARWTYDEARHTRMGLERLGRWGFEPDELPLGTYIFDSARGQDPIIRLGFLHYFETKNIGKKNERAEAFASYEDAVSQHDMEFDWADETIHAHYGRKWLDALRAKYPQEVPDRDTLLSQCETLVEDVIASATPEDISTIRAVANAMIDKAGKQAE
jgi:hypothetical protein